MKYKLISAVLITASLLAMSYGCSSKEDSSSTTKTITYTVKQGDISLEVISTGNLALSTTEDLSFDIAGTVEEVLVSDGETVTEGQELARLDTSVWDNQVESLEQALVTARRSLTNAERNVSAKELALRQAELSEKEAEESLSQITIVKYALLDVENAETALQTAQTNYQTDPSLWASRIEAISRQLVEAKEYLNEVLTGASMNVSSDVALQIEKKLLEIDQSKLQLDNARVDLEDVQTAVEDANTAVATAQIDLAEARSLSPTITAPFAGFITKVNISGGDEVQKGTVAMQLADPEKFKANIQVTEQDIFSIAVGGNAMVSIDALSDIIFPATITAIAPLATVSQGVVSYKVTVELNTDLTSTAGDRPFPQTSSNTDNMTPPSGFTPPGNTANLTASIASLKDGLSATVTIVVTQANDVLIVPSRALTRQGQTYTVQVQNGDTTETRTVTIGTNDDSYTEITGGLSEGEVIVYTSSSSSSSSSSSGMQFPGGMGDMGGGMPPGGF